MGALRIEKLSKNFDGLEVLKDLSLEVKTGECIAVIGPNGAGKTTLLNVLSGRLPVSAGRIFILGQEVSHIPTHTRTHIGLARSFQKVSLFNNLTAMENILLALHGTRPSRYQMFKPITMYNDLLGQAKELLESVGLWDKRDYPIPALSHGEQRKMEVVTSLASDPKVLLLDEPCAGLAMAEIPDLIRTIKRLASKTTLIFVEHDMNVVFGLADRVVVLYFGKIVAQGPPQEIQNNALVRNIYLGDHGHGEKESL